MKNRIKLIFVLLCTMVLKNCDRRNSDIVSIENELELIGQKTKAAGFAITVIKEDSVVYSNGFGYRDLKNRLPVNENTLFPIGSCTKAFTSSLLGLLNSKGKISFNDFPSLYIPELEFWNDTLNSSISLNTMSMHKTGLPRYEVPAMLIPLKSRYDLIGRVKYYRPQSGVNEKFIYNNHMYALLGIVSERVEEKTWEGLIRQEIFTPLEMSRSNCTTDELTKSDNIALGYTTLPDNTNKHEAYFDLSALAPAGVINSSVIEMAHWLKSWINNGAYKGKTVLPESHVVELVNSIGQIDYNHGWSLGFYKGIEKLEHGGNIAGFTSRVVLFPRENIGIVVLANQTHSLLPQIVANTASDVMLNLDRTNWVKELGVRRDNTQASNESNKSPELNPLLDHTTFTGNYGHPAFGSFQVFAEKDSLFINTGMNNKIWLKPYGKNVFDLIEPGKHGNELNHIPYLFKFFPGDNGDISAVKMESDDGDLFFNKVDY